MTALTKTFPQECLERLYPIVPVLNPVIKFYTLDCFPMGDAVENEKKGMRSLDYRSNICTYHHVVIFPANRG
jgi:hypothetical protein